MESGWQTLLLLAIGAIALYSLYAHIRDGLFPLRRRRAIRLLQDMLRRRGFDWFLIGDEAVGTGSNFTLLALHTRENLIVFLELRKNAESELQLELGIDRISDIRYVFSTSHYEIWLYSDTATPLRLDLKATRFKGDEAFLQHVEPLGNAFARVVGDDKIAIKNYRT